ncbi:AraC family transcriptional regulator [Pseudomonas sp. BN411]|uniref:AraC-like transcriptional regulator QhpR n=1 Tax=Pseudomonas sp. BN411 TaxID=2567887 RepID=UPI0024562E39|nr:AraC family transcriptional regulator [Pseudomonas sp. BN411]MDH4561125.1 AraC family transcriptional regulator [Pseudomonas sp. BN411]
MTSFVRGIALLGFDEFAISQGLDAHAVLAEAGLPTDALDGLISGGKFNALLELCARRTGNPLFGLQFGLHQGSQALGGLLYLIQSARTVGDALKALAQYFHVHSSGAELHLERQGDQARFLYEVVDGEAASVRQTVELAMGIGAQLMQSLLGHPWKPNALWLRHPAASEPGAYRRLLGVTPRFGGPVNAWVFDAALLETPLSATDERFQQSARRQLNELARLTVQELPAYVQKLLRQRLHTGHISIEQIAGHMQLSPRTLQRYLQAEGTSFQELLDQTRQAMATRYICDSSIKLTQLAALLGYADLSVFSRAFTRWNGVSPQKWKQRFRQAQLLAESGAAPASFRPPRATGQ